MLSKLPLSHTFMLLRIIIFSESTNKNKKNKGCDIFFASKILYNKGIMVKYPWFLWIKGRGVSHDFFHF